MSNNERMVRSEIAGSISSGNGDKIRKNIDRVVEALYSRCFGDVGRGDVRRWVLDELEET